MKALRFGIYILEPTPWSACAAVRAQPNADLGVKYLAGISDLNLFSAFLD